MTSAERARPETPVADGVRRHPQVNLLDIGKLIGRFEIALVVMLVADSFEKQVDDGGMQIIACSKHRLCADQSDVARRRQRHELDGACMQRASGQVRIPLRIGISLSKIHQLQGRIGQRCTDCR